MIELILALFLTPKEQAIDLNELCKSYSLGIISREEAQAQLDTDSKDTYEIQIEELCE